MLVWVLLIAAPTTVGVVQLRAMAHGAPGVHLQFNAFSMDLPRGRFLSFAADTAAYRWAHQVAATNLPGFVGELLISRSTKTWPMSWHPASIMLDSWRAISYPILCLPFWWFAGLGLDGFLGHRRIRWPILLIGTVLSVISFVLLIGLRFGTSASERESLVYPLWGFGLWGILLLPFPFMWAKRGRSALSSKEEQARQA